MGLDLSESAVPTIDSGKCSACGLCAENCPAETLALKGSRIVVEARGFMGCIGCGQCTSLCPTGAIQVTGRRMGPGQLTDLPPADRWATADQLDGLLLSRRSVRRFRDKAVDRPLVDRVLDMASTAPVGIPPNDVGVVVFQGRQKVRAFVAEAVDAFRRLEVGLRPPFVWLMRLFTGKAEYTIMRQFVQPLLRHIVSRYEAGEDVFCYDAPVLMLFHHTPSTDAADIHITATYAMLAAQSLGLGTCMLGTPVAFNQVPKLKAKYGIPVENKVGLGLILGHPAVSYQRSLRRTLASVKYV
jgi:ferredoxin